jgi:hypothetical protein
VLRCCWRYLPYFVVLVLTLHPSKQSKMLLLFAYSLFPASLVSKERAWHLDRRSEQRQNFTHRILIVNEEKMRPSESKNVIFIHAWMMKMPSDWVTSHKSTGSITRVNSSGCPEGAGTSCCRWRLILPGGSPFCYISISWLCRRPQHSKISHALLGNDEQSSRTNNCNCFILILSNVNT